MQSPKIPRGESERLGALRELDVLDSGPEPAFDTLARLAALAMGTPIALVSLVDAERQWFKARHGLDVGETPRDVSFCGHVVADDAPLVVRDAHSDERFADNPLVTGDPRVRFYAGMPLRTRDGRVLGALCAIDHAPREPTAAELEALELLATQVVAQLEARRARRALAEHRAKAEASARQLASLLEAMAEGVVVHDRDGRIVQSNSAALGILGVTRDSLHGLRTSETPIRAIRESGDAVAEREYPATRARLTGEAQIGVVMGVRRPNEEITWLSVNSIPRHDADGNVLEVITTFHDITTLKTATQRLHEQERLATTGTLAAGIGHEINNPLAYVGANLEFAYEELRTGGTNLEPERLEEIRHALADARDGAGRIGRIVRGLRALSRQDVALVGVSVESVIETAVSMAAHELNRATVVVEPIEVPLVLADESRLTQVLVNLLVNAAQAFDGNDRSNNRVEIGARVVDGRIHVEVRDNGPGVPPAIERRIFDPFFTSKPVGQGTGLGLSVSRSIMAALGGELRLEPSRRGATFSVILSRAPDDSASDAARQRRGRVLVIDDEPAVLATIKRILEREHDVVVVADPREALRVLEADGASYDVVLCDISMPHLTGEELFEKVAATQPAVAGRFVFVSGCAVRASPSFLQRIDGARLDKPFAAQKLLGLVRRHVRAGSSSASSLSP